MTIDEAIIKHIQIADSYHKAMPNYDEAAEHRQIAEWLTELKQWRRVYGVCPSYEMCIPECKEGYNAQIAEYKRLLKMAVDAIYELLDCGASCSGKFCDKYCIYNCETCPLNEEDGTIECGEWRKWKHADEALKLIGGTNDEP